MRKFLFIFSLLLAICGNVGATVRPHDFADVYFYYKVVDAEKLCVQVVDVNNIVAEITIPASVTYNDVTYQVTELGDSCFYHGTSRTSITLSDGVTTIGRNCFEGCTNLASINLPSTLVSIGASCFKKCTSLRSITIPEGVTTIGDSCFYELSGLTSVTLPNSLTSLGKKAFYWCTSLTSIEIPEGVTELGAWTFGMCLELAKVKLPKSLTKIGDGCFHWCTSLTECTLPENIKEIGSSAFSNCWELKTLSLPKTLTYLGDCAFAVCKELTDSIFVPEGTTEFGRRCFYECYNIPYIYIPESVTSFGDECFEQCTNLTQKIKIPEGVTEVPYSCFFNCHKIYEIEMPEGVTTIGNSAFRGCTNLKSIDLREPLSEIEAVAFRDCTSLENITLPKSLRGIGQEAFSGCEKLKYVIIPEGVERISFLAFCGCDSLSYAYIPRSAKGVGTRCFAGCESLKVLCVGSSDTNISDYGFSYPWAKHTMTDVYILSNEELDSICDKSNPNKYCQLNVYWPYFTPSLTADDSYVTRNEYGEMPMLHFRPDIKKTAERNTFHSILLDNYENNWSLPDKFFGNRRRWPSLEDADSLSQWDVFKEYDWTVTPLWRADAPLLDAVVPITDNTWHTLCLPINWTPDKDVYGDYQLLTLTRVLRNADNNTIKFIFSPSSDTCVVAWKPYLFKAGDDFVYDPEKATRILDYPLQPGSEQYVAITAEQVGQKKESTEWTYYWVGNNEGLYHKSGEETDGFSIDRPRYAYYLGERGGDTSLFFQRTTSQRVWAPYTAAIMAYCEDYQTDETPGITVNDDFRDEDGTANAQKTIITCFGDEGGETTVIEELYSPVEQRVNGDIFDISGRKVASDTQGLKNLPAGVYICNGKKVLVK